LTNKQALTLLFASNAISGFAQGISMLAIPWYFAQQGRSPQFNGIYASVTLLTLFWSLYAGTLVDRFSRKGVFLATNIIEGIVVLSVAGYGLYTGSLPIPLIILVFMATIFGFQIHYPNLYAFVQQITRPEEYSRVTSIIEIVGQSTSVMAGAIAAVLLEGVSVDKQWMLAGQHFSLAFTIPRWELYEIFLLDGSTYVVAVVLISLIRYTPIRTFEVDTSAFLKRLRSGFSFLKRNQLIFVFGILSYTVFASVLVKLHGLMPMYVNNHLQAGGNVFGLAEVLYAAGALSAGIVVRKVFSNTSTSASVIVLIFITTSVYFLASITQSVWVYLLICILVGFSNAGTRIMRVTFIFGNVPNELIGRVNSVFSMGNIIMRVSFLALFIQAFFNQGSNVVFAYGILSVFLAVAGIILLLNFKRLSTMAV
jgi:MFS transporter, DHA3 family, macrolide efflux protein